jgi:hypothetical protein
MSKLKALTAFLLFIGFGVNAQQTINHTINSKIFGKERKIDDSGRLGRGHFSSTEAIIPATSVVGALQEKSRQT